MKEKQTIVARILAILNLGEEGKIGHFFTKQVKSLQREIDGLKRNIVTLTYNSDLAIDQLREKLEDAKAELDAAYLNITPADVETNAKQDEFSATYWSNVERAEAKVTRLEKTITEGTDCLKDQIKDNEEQIKERERRIEKIS